MKVDCQKIDGALELLINDGNKIKNISEGWSKSKKVFEMEEVLKPHIKKVILSEFKGIRYWEYEGDAHNLRENGFKCDDCSCVISFPCK